MGDEVLPPPLFLSSMFTYLYIISHQCNASESNFKEYLGVQDILIHQKACLLYTSDAADDMQCVDLGGRRIIKKIELWGVRW